MECRWEIRRRWNGCVVWWRRRGGASDLGRLLGNRSLGSLLLTGRRELSKAHVRLLAEHFKVDAGYFL